MQLKAKCPNCNDGWLILETSNGLEAKAVCNVCGVTFDRYVILHPPSDNRE
jgi:uncharacterized protein (DUF983 family)